MSTQPTGESRTLDSTTRQSPPLRDMALGALGGIAGACLGYILFHVIARQGFYALVLPGALTGIVCGSLSRHRSIILGIVCALVGTTAGIITEWRFAPFTQDNSFGYFILHLHQLRSFTQLLIVIGGMLAFWFGLGRNGGAWLRKSDG